MEIKWLSKFASTDCAAAFVLVKYSRKSMLRDRNRGYRHRCRVCISCTADRCSLQFDFTSCISVHAIQFCSNTCAAALKSPINIRRTFSSVICRMCQPMFRVPLSLRTARPIVLRFGVWVHGRRIKPAEKIRENLRITPRKCKDPLCVYFIFTYPAVRSFYFHLPCCAFILFSLTLLCVYFIFAYPAVPLFYFHLPC